MRWHLAFLCAASCVACRPVRDKSTAQATCCAECCDRCIVEAVDAVSKITIGASDACLGRIPLLQLAAGVGQGPVWFSTRHNASLLVLRAGKDAGGTILSLHVALPAQCGDEIGGMGMQKAQLILDGGEADGCSSLPCDMMLPITLDGPHVLDATFTCGSAQMTEQLLFEVRPQRRDLLNPPQDSASARIAALRRLVQWRTLPDAGGELWAHIAVQDALDYENRHRLSPDQIEAPASCPPQSVCGVWAVEAGAGAHHDSSACVDLCVGTEFLPPLQALVRNTEEMQDAAYFQQHLFNSQFRAPNGDAVDDHRDMRPAGSPLSGFGVTMVYAAHNLAKSATAQRLFAPTRQGLHVWTSEVWCGHERNLACYFLAPTNHTFEILDSTGSARQLDPEREGAHAGIDGIAHDFAPTHVAARGAFWLHAQSLHFLWQLNQRTRGYLDTVRRQMGEANRAFVFPFRQATIGMHIRRGDSFMAARWMPGLDQFLVPARRMQHLYNVTHIFLSTDCAETAQQCHELQDFTCATLPLERSVYDVGASHAPEYNPKESAYDQWIERRIQLGEVDGSLAALHAIAEVDTLASCDYLIGRLDSAISRLVCV